MKTRIITAIFAISALVCVILAGDKIFGGVIFLLSIIAMREFLNCFKDTNYKPIKSVSYISTLWLLILLLRKYLTIDLASIGVILYIIIIALSLPIIFKSDKYNIGDIAVTLFGILYIPFLFSFLTLTRGLENGIYYIWMIFIGASVTDTFAYFVGCSIGKHKLAPKVSPKKTIEGAIGGVVGTVGVMSLYGLYLNSYIKAINIPMVHFVVIGLITAIVSQLGDLGASSIKRYVNIKDYGFILPGHGGILDRFDSIMFIAPIIYFYFKLLGGI